jgi:hypothetical protein
LPNIISAIFAGFIGIISGEATQAFMAFNIGCFDDINIRDYMANDINDGVSMSLVDDNERRSF